MSANDDGGIALRFMRYLTDVAMWKIVAVIVAGFVVVTIITLAVTW